MQEQYFNGIRFTIGPGRKYFSNSNVKPRSMHCYVWSYYNGEIPKGYEVHHKDLNRYNNDISNLELLEKHEHKKLHGRILTDEQREWRRNNINEKARPKAIEWHKSQEGKEWHEKQVKTRKDNRKQVTGNCLQCGKEILGYNNVGHTKKFCSGACAQKYRRDNGLNNVERICVICGKPFIADKYGHKQTCGKSCGVTLAWKNGKTGKIGNKKFTNRKGN